MYGILDKVINSSEAVHTRDSRRIMGLHTRLGALEERALNVSKTCMSNGKVPKRLFVLHYHLFNDGKRVFALLLHPGCRGLTWRGSSLAWRAASGRGARLDSRWHHGVNC